MGDLWDERAVERRRRALLDGTALAEAVAMLPFETADEVAKKEVPPDSLPGECSASGER